MVPPHIRGCESPARVNAERFLQRCTGSPAGQWPFPPPLFFTPSLHLAPLLSGMSLLVPKAFLPQWRYTTFYRLVSG